jgi:hypothetical protein
VDSGIEFVDKDERPITAVRPRRVCKVGGATP